MIHPQSKTSGSSREHRFLDASDIVSSTWKATVDCRENSYETGVRYPLFSGEAYFPRGISIPLRESVILHVGERWNYASFVLFVDGFVLPETRVACRLVVRSDDETVYESPAIDRSTAPIRVSLPVFGRDSLSIELREVDRFVCDSPDNWADLSYLGVDLANFVWSEQETIDLPDSLGRPTVNENVGMEVTPIELPSSTWTVRYLEESSPESRGMILAGCFDNHVYCLSTDGKLLWKTQLDGLPHAIVVCRANGGLRLGIHCWSIQSDLTILDVDGRHVSTLAGETRIKAVAACGDRLYALDNSHKIREYDGSGRFLRAIELPQITGRTMFLRVTEVVERPEIRFLVGTTNNLLCFDSNGSVVWQRTINPNNPFLSATHSLESVVNEGSTCFVVGSRPGSVSLIDADGELLWRDRYVGRGHSEPEIAVGDFLGTGQSQIAAVAPDGWFHLFDTGGHRIKQWSARVPFVDLDTVGGQTNRQNQTIVAASVGPRDRRIYLLRLDRNRADAGLHHVPGFREDHVTPTMQELGSRVSGCGFHAENPNDRSVVFLYDPFGGNYTNPEAFYDARSLPEVYRRLSWVKELADRYSGNRVRFLPMLDLWSCVYHKERRPVLDSQLNLDVLAEVERIGLPFCLFVMHVDSVPLDDLKRVVTQNRRTLQAVHLSETVGRPQYKRHVFELARSNGLRVLYGVHRDFWLNVAQDPAERDVLLAEENHGVFVPILKSNPSCYDLNLMSTLGLWRDGTIADWGVSSQHWNWNWYVRNLDPLYPLDLLFRHDFHAASLGATWYLPEGDFTQSTTLTESFTRARKPFYEMLRRGFFPIDSPDQNIRVSGTCIRYKKAPAHDSMQDNRPGHFLTTGLRDGLLQPPAEGSYSKEVSGIRRYAEGLLPRMPYGFVPIVPERRPLEEVSGWSTDGIHLYRDGQRQDNACGLKNDLAEGTKGFPVHCADAFLAVQDVGGAVFVYVSTIGYFYPMDEDVTIRFHPKLKRGRRCLEMLDLLEDRTIIVDGTTLTLGLRPGEIKVFKIE